MAQITLIGGLMHQTKESKEEIIELIEGDKQFIFIESRQTVSVYVNACMDETKVEWWIIAVNKNHIIQVF